MQQRYGWVLVMVCGAVIVAISMGIRQSFGLFIRPMTADFGIGREAFSFALALQNLVFGIAMPFAGALADRYGSRLVIAVGTVLYAAGLALTTVVSGQWGLTATLGVLVGLAQSGTTFVVVFGALGLVVPAVRRSLAFGIVTAGGSFGMFVFVPLVQAFQLNLGWQTTMLILTAIAGSMAVLGLGVGGRTRGTAAITTAGARLSLGAMLALAQRTPSYWLLNMGFFVCGFHVAFIGIHYPAFLADQAIAPDVAANALALIGLGNIVGSYVAGMLGDHLRKTYVLSGLYMARAVTIVLFLLLPISDLSALVFGATIGLLWLGTVPLTSGIVAQMFGVRYLATLYGVVFLSHQVGAFLGAWLGGFAFDRLGSYTAVWLAAVALGITAAVIHLFVSEDSLLPEREGMRHAA